MLLATSPAEIGGIVKDSAARTTFSFSGPAEVCSINVAELHGMRTGPWEIVKLNLRGITIEKDSFSAIRSASGDRGRLWRFADIMEEVVALARSVEASFVNINRTANSDAGAFAKERIHRAVLAFSYADSWLAVLLVVFCGCFTLLMLMIPL